MEIAGHYYSILAAVGGEDPDREGLKETPERAARAMRELTDGYSVDVGGLLKVFNSEEYDEMIVVAGIDFASLCEHHLLPFVGQAHVVYIPNGKIVGLSKIPRLVDAFSRRLQVQERMTMQIADALERHLHPEGVMVMVEATHSCAALRGVKKPNVVMRTSALRGLIKEDAAARDEALRLIRGGK